MKINRHAKIVELVNKYHIETQEELADRLHQEGYKVTQATVSRDIRDLKLTKVQTEAGRQKYAALQMLESKLTEKYARILRDGFISMDIAQNILVIKTVSGMAMAVAAAMNDNEAFEALSGMECYEGGSCTFVCPAGRRLTQAFRQTRRAVLDARRKK